MRYTPATVTIARKAARIVRGLYDEPHAKVDLALVLEMTGTPSQRELLTSTMGPWLRGVHGIKEGMLYWSFTPGVDASVMHQALYSFARFVTTTLAVSATIRSAAAAIRMHGWAQSDNSGQGSGFSVIGAIGSVDGGQDVMMRVAVLDALRSRLQTIYNTTSLTEWNDDPARTASEVIQFLDACASDIETV